MGVVCPFLPVHNNIVSCVTCFAGLSVSLPGSLKLGGESPECSVKKITKERPVYKDSRYLIKFEI